MPAGGYLIYTTQPWHPQVEMIARTLINRDGPDEWRRVGLVDDYGQKIELRMLDDGYEPARAKANTETFLNGDVFALFGYVGTPTSLASLPLAVWFGNRHITPADLRAE